MANTTRTGTAKFTIRVGFHAPGVFAAFVHKAVEIGQTCAKVTDGLGRLQGEFNATCPACNSTWPLQPFDEATAVQLYNLASRLEYRDFLAEVERRYAPFEAACPRCDVRGGLA